MFHGKAELIREAAMGDENQSDHGVRVRAS
jgi:hypothetical protein